MNIENGFCSHSDGLALVQWQRFSDYDNRLDTPDKSKSGCNARLCRVHSRGPPASYSVNFKEEGPLSIGSALEVPDGQINFKGFATNFQNVNSFNSPEYLSKFQVGKIRYMGLKISGPVCCSFSTSDSTYLTQVLMGTSSAKTISMAVSPKQPAR